MTTGFNGPLSDCEPDRFERDPTKAEQQRAAELTRKEAAARCAFCHGSGTYDCLPLAELTCPECHGTGKATP